MLQQCGSLMWHHHAQVLTLTSQFYCTLLWGGGGGGGDARVVRFLQFPIVPEFKTSIIIEGLLLPGVL